MIGRVKGLPVVSRFNLEIMSDSNLVTWTVYSNYTAKQEFQCFNVSSNGKFCPLEAAIIEKESKKKLKDKFLKS